MSLMADQTWVENWKGRPSAFETDYITSWLTLQDREWHPLLEKFPPFCIIRAKAGKVLETPCPYSVALVRGYWDDHTLAVTYEPTDDETACASVNPDDVEVVGFWKGLDHLAMKRLLH